MKLDKSLEPFRAAIESLQQLLHKSNLSIRLPTPEDLIIMKAIAHRLKDLEDIRTIADKHSDLDINRIEEWVKSFGDAMDLPDLWGQVRLLLE
jgi:hypothetical protein